MILAILASIMHLRISQLGIILFNRCTERIIGNRVRLHALKYRLDILVVAHQRRSLGLVGVDTNIHALREIITIDSYALQIMRAIYSNTNLHIMVPTKI